MKCKAISPNVITCGPFGKPSHRKVMHCPTCERRRRFGCHYGGMWYGSTVKCTACGDTWMEGDRMTRPFRPGWKKESIETARRWWAEAMTAREFKQYLKAEWADWKSEE